MTKAYILVFADKEGEHTVVDTDRQYIKDLEERLKGFTTYSYIEEVSQGRV